MTTTATHLAALNVRGEMARKGFTQTRVASALGVSQASVSARLRGVTPFSIDELVTLAQVLDVPLDRLLEGVEVPAAAEAAS
jgi:transcriptional regulator with XRE-family HTH domain